MNTVAIIVPGKPIAKKRPRFARRGNFVQTYSDQQTEEGKFLLAARAQYNGELLTGALCMVTEFVMPRPKGHFGTGRNVGKLKKSAPTQHISKPDIDNLKKFVMDCLNGEVYKDDAQIVYSFSEKRYVKDGESPTTYIHIYQDVG